MGDLTKIIEKRDRQTQPTGTAVILDLLWQFPSQLYVLTPRISWSRYPEEINKGSMDVELWSWKI